MRIGLIGLGKMGGNMRVRLRRNGIEVLGLDHNPDLSDVVDEAALVAGLGDGPRVVWLMVPIQAVTPLIETLRPLLAPGDVVIDGGNSKWTHDARHAAWADRVVFIRDGRIVDDTGLAPGVDSLLDGAES